MTVLVERDGVLCWPESGYAPDLSLPEPDLTRMALDRAWIMAPIAHRLTGPLRLGDAVRCRGCSARGVWVCEGVVVNPGPGQEPPVCAPLVPHEWMRA